MSDPMTDNTDRDETPEQKLTAIGSEWATYLARSADEEDSRIEFFASTLAAHNERVRQPLDRPKWEQAVSDERARHESLGWTREHDDAHGPDHLILQTIEYAFQGKTVEVAALQLALRDVLRAYTERVRAEQREADYHAVEAGMPELGALAPVTERCAGIIEGVGRSLDAIRVTGQQP